MEETKNRRMGFLLTLNYQLDIYCLRNFRYMKYYLLLYFLLLFFSFCYLLICLLLSPLQLYFDKITELTVSRSNSILFKQALVSLATDSGLHPLVPYFTYFVADEVIILRVYSGITNSCRKIDINNSHSTVPFHDVRYLVV